MKSVVKSLVFGVILLIGALGAVWFFTSKGPIVSYSAARDRSFIIDTFKKDWYWLISDYSPNFDVPFLLDHKSPSGKKGSDVGILIIKTYIENGKPLGFVMYYPKDFKIGQFLFLGVDQGQRRKGIAMKLAVYAIEDMKRLGMLGVKLTTRTDNIKAQNLYEGLGFKQIWTDGAYMIYERIF